MCTSLTGAGAEALRLVKGMGSAGILASFRVGAVVATAVDGWHRNVQDRPMCLGMYLI